MAEALTTKTDDELLSLIGQAHAILSDRARARKADFDEAIRKAEERHRNPAGRSALAALEGGEQP